MWILKLFLCLCLVCAIRSWRWSVSIDSSVLHLLLELSFALKPCQMCVFLFWILGGSGGNWMEVSFDGNKKPTWWTAGGGNGANEAATTNMQFSCFLRGSFSCEVMAAMRDFNPGHLVHFWGEFVLFLSSLSRSLSTLNPKPSLLPYHVNF